MRDAMRQDTESTTDVLAQLKRHNNVEQNKQKDTPQKENSNIYTHETTSMAQQQSSNDPSSQNEQLDNFIPIRKQKPSYAQK